ncbi:hypothetical protein [carnivorous sponge associated iridovirus]|nr:hypothetical protein [carnivorous sponge associated iridovirus]
MKTKKHCTATGAFRYDHPFNTIPLKDWVQAVHRHMACTRQHLSNPERSAMTTCVCLFQNLTFDVEPLLTLSMKRGQRTTPSGWKTSPGPTATGSPMSLSATNDAINVPPPSTLIFPKMRKRRIVP